MRQIDSIKCCVCGEKIQRNHVTCKKCYPEYRQYFKETWFVELVHMQRIQDFIDTEECYPLEIKVADVDSRATHRGNMKITEDMIYAAKNLRNQKYSLRKIGFMLGVSYNTVRNMLKR